MGLFKRPSHFNDFVHDSKMMIYANLSEMMINDGLSYLFWECTDPKIQEILRIENRAIINRNTATFV